MGTPDLGTPVSSAAEGAPGLLSLPGVLNCCYYQQPGKGCKARPLQREAGSTAPQIISATVNTFPSAESLESKQQF